MLGPPSGSMALAADGQPCRSPPLLVSPARGGAHLYRRWPPEPLRGNLRATTRVVAGNAGVAASPSRVDDPRRRSRTDGRVLDRDDPAAVGARWGSHLHLLADPVTEQRLGQRRADRDPHVVQPGLDRMDDQEPLHDTLGISNRHGLAQFSFRRTYHSAIAKLADPATQLRPTAARLLKTLRVDGSQTVDDLVAALAQQGRAVRPATVETALETHPTQVPRRVF
jgi:hypothetical protein